MYLDMVYCVTYENIDIRDPYFRIEVEGTFES
jgi:hypothetical protein